MRASYGHGAASITILPMGSVVSHGIDIVGIARIERMLESHGERFIERCFAPAERDYAEAGGRSRSQRYAVRFAAKEAVMKALGTGWAGGVAWTDIMVERNAAGAPSLRLNGPALDLATRRGISAWHLSLSHTADLAIASVIATSH